jgi:muramoyltetrapeptide carboxypeptidase
MEIPTIQPPALKKGGTIAVVAPASPIDQRADLERGIVSLQKLGFRVQFNERIFESSRYLAGDDLARAEELMRAFEDPATDAIIALRGGYGCARLIPLLKSRRLRAHPKILMGFSDLTTLMMYFRKRFGWITIHGPMAVSPTLINMPQEQADHLIALLTDPGYRPVLHFDQLESWTPGVAEGELVGGCLAILTASLGTRYEINTDGKILFLEDLGEPPYRLDRMLTHLLLAGKFRSIAGVLLGDFIDCEPGNGRYKSADVLRDILATLHVPVMAHFPLGHGDANWAVPFGARARMDAGARTLELLDGAVRSAR